MAAEDRRRIGSMERHVQTALTGIICALLAWVGVTLIDLRDRTARLEVELLNLKIAVRDSADDRFTLNDWMRERERLDERYADLVKRVDNLERKR